MNETKPVVEGRNKWIRMVCNAYLLIANHLLSFVLCYLSTIKINPLEIYTCRCNFFVPLESIKCRCGNLIAEHSQHLVKMYLARAISKKNKEFGKSARFLDGYRDMNQKINCLEFSPDKFSVCGCGKAVDEHQEDAIENFLRDIHKLLSTNNDLKKWEWNREECTANDVLTNAFGEVRFLGRGEQKISKFVRVSHQTKTDKITQILFGKQFWRLKCPKLIISVTGGTTLNITQSFKDSFCKGLVKAAMSTDSWVISGGVELGCMKLVGQAFRENALNIDPNKKTVVLGIANWRTIREKEFLVTDTRKDSEFPVEYEAVPKKSEKEKTALLDPNHTHFILVDDANNLEFGGEITLRSKIEIAISEQNWRLQQTDPLKASKTSPSRHIPTVVLALGGGRHTVVQILESLKRDIPCIFFDETGKFTNIFSSIIKRIERDEPIFKDKYSAVQEFTDEFRSEITYEIKNEFAKDYVRTRMNYKDDKTVDKVVRNIEACFQRKYKHLLTCYRLNPNDQTNDVDVAILIGLLKAYKTKIPADLIGDELNKEAIKVRENIKTQLTLCMAWNRYDIAKNFIFIDDFQEKFGSLDDFMYQAISNNQPEFAKLFLENGFVLKNFVTYRRLIKLYNDAPRQSALKKLLKSRDSVKDFDNLGDLVEQFDGKRRDTHLYTLRNIGNVIQQLISNFYAHRFTRPPISQIEQKHTRTVYAETDKHGNATKGSIGIFNFLEANCEVNVNERANYPEHELFIYSILLGRAQLAKVFWIEGNNPICAALIASKILKNYALKFDIEKASFLKMADEFETMAFNVLDVCFKKNEEKTKSLLIKPVQEYGNSTPLQLAIMARDLKFVSHLSCQKLLIKLWFGKVIPETSPVKLYTSMLIPLIAPMTVNFIQSKRHGQRKINSIRAAPAEDDSSDEEADDIMKYDDHVVIPLSRRETAYQASNRLIVYIKRVYFFVNSPIVKFVYNQVFYIMFLLLFSYVMLCDFFPLYSDQNKTTHVNLPISATEVLLIAWVTSFLLEEIRKMFKHETKLLKAKIKYYLLQNWNVIGLTALLLYYIGLVLRFIPNANCFLAARVFMCISVIFWYFRSLTAYWFIRSVGPMLVLIERMVKQLFYFVLIVILFMFAFGVATQSLMYHNQPLNNELLKNVFFPSFFVIFKEYYTRNTLMNADSCVVKNPNRSLTDIYSNTDCPDPTGANVSLAIYVFYIILLNLLLLNLLIAIFNNKFIKIELEANKIWKFQRYSLVYEYFFKPLLPPPFIIFSFVFKLLKLVIRSIFRNQLEKIKFSTNQLHRFIYYFTKRSADGFIVEFVDSDEKYRLIKWENLALDEYIKHADATDGHEKLGFLKLDVFNKKLMFLDDHVRAIEKKLDMLSMNRIENQRTTRRESEDFAYQSNIQMARRVQSLQERRREDSAGVISLYDDENRASKHRVKSLAFEDEDPSYDRYSSARPSLFSASSPSTKHKNDIDLLAYPINLRPALNFNDYDKKYQVNRRSCEGYYRVEEGLPINPTGRKNKTGRGKFFYWGPNHAIQLIITRQSRSARPILEVLVYIGTKKPALPKILYENTNYISTDFIQRIISKLFVLEGEYSFGSVQKLFENPKYLGAFIPENDEESTDNAWIEYTVVNYHDKTNNVLGKIELKDRMERKLAWVSIIDLVERVDFQTESYLRRLIELYLE